jgi:hypothetical protein
VTHYPTRKDGEWVHWSRRGHLVACCDCGLVHLFRPRVVRNGRVEVSAKRMPQNTGGRRSRKKQ